MALGGLVLLIITSMGRRRSRRLKPAAAGAIQKWQRWGELAAFGLIAAGLLVMWAQK